MQVTDRPSPDAPSLTQAIIVQMVYSESNVFTERVIFLPIPVNAVLFQILVFVVNNFENCF